MPSTCASSGVSPSCRLWRPVLHPSCSFAGAGSAIGLPDFHLLRGPFSFVAQLGVFSASPTELSPQPRPLRLPRKLARFLAMRLPPWTIRIRERDEDRGEGLRLVPSPLAGGEQAEGELRWRGLSFKIASNAPTLCVAPCPKRPATPLLEPCSRSRLPRVSKGMEKEELP